jgi:hypothetical protein
MNTKLISVLVAFCLLIPALSTAQIADSSLNVGSSYTPGSYAQFEANISNFEDVNETVVSVLTISDIKLKDVSSADFLASSGWVKIPLRQSNADVVGNFVSKTGFETGNHRIIDMRINFKSAGTYILGYSLASTDGKIISSAASPITIGGSKVLGVATSAQTFTRRLSVGSSGADVTALQNRLTTESFYSGPITGYFGAQTKAAVVKYQIAHGLAAVGSVGPQTQALLSQ